MKRILFFCFTMFIVFAQSKYKIKEIDYSNNNVKISASLLLPDQAKKLPAAILVHGSGNSDRSNPWTTAYAEALAERGLIVLHPDKRGSGKSGGDWKKATLKDLAMDAVAAVNYLLTRPEVDTSKICLIGFSQGGDVIPIAGTLSKEVDLIISISSSVVSLKEQISDEVEKEAEREGIDRTQMKELDKLNQLGFSFAFGESSWQEYIYERDRLSNTQLGDTETFKAFPKEKDIWVWNWLKMNTKISPLDYWKKTNVPVLFIYGGNDTQIKIKKSIDLIYSELEPLKKNFSILYFSKNGHALFRDDCNDFILNWIQSKGKY